jgi:hypothetical protein
MATKKSKKSTAWMDDHDDAHFSDNPAVPKRTRRKWETEDKKKIAASSKDHSAVKVTKKTTAKKTARKRVAGK